jgi:midasin (ATPase involved in ribosome maturation)
MLFRREQRVAGFENEYESIDDNALYKDKYFFVHPFMISTGEVEILDRLGFKLSAPTTGMNPRRVLRAMQISKPILLEGSPGNRKTRYVFGFYTLLLIEKNN